jgi:hypothetical protein
MKIIELGAWRTPVSNEENLLLAKISEHKGLLPKSCLSLREKQIAKNLVARGVLTRLKRDDKLYYSFEDPSDQWRI